MKNNFLEGQLLEKFGSPLFVVDKSKLLSQFRKLREGFNRLYPTIVAYSYKTNYLPYICDALVKEGAYSEIIPGFEFGIAKKLKVPGGNIIVNGPYKPEKELAEMLKYGCRINVDNADELKLISRLAKQIGITAKIGIRVNMAVGQLPWSKFGFNLESGEARKAVDIVRDLDNIELVGIHVHIGTNVNVPVFYSEAVEKIIQFCRENENKISLEYLDIGGGFASSGAAPTNIGLEKWHVPDVKEYAEAVCLPLKEHFGKDGPYLILEPGRFIVDEAFSLLTKVIVVKEIFGIRSVFVDAGVNVLPSSYYRTHLVEAVSGNHQGNILTDIYGPLCMQADVLESGVVLPDLSVGDILKINTCGAYELSQSMQFIRPRPAVISLDGTGTVLIRRREILDDVTAADIWESIP